MPFAMKVGKLCAHPIRRLPENGEKFRRLDVAMWLS
jgi:hypothetical protein